MNPGAYSKPITMTFMATKKEPPQDDLLEYICQANNQYGAATIPGYSGPKMGGKSWEVTPPARLPAQPYQDGG